MLKYFAVKIALFIDKNFEYYSFMLFYYCLTYYNLFVPEAKLIIQMLINWS